MIQHRQVYNETKRSRMGDEDAETVLHVPIKVQRLSIRSWYERESNYSSIYTLTQFHLRSRFMF